MANLAIIGLTFYPGAGAPGSLQSTDLGVFLEITEGMDDLAPLRGEDAILPMRSGRVYLPRVADGKTIVLTGFVSDTQASPILGYRTGIDWLKALFSPWAGLGLLVATMEDGTKRRIRAGAANIMMGELTDPGRRACSVQLQSPDSCWTTNWGNLTLDDGHSLDEEVAHAEPWDWALDDSALMLIWIPTNPYTFQFDSQSKADVERVRIRLENTKAPAPAMSVTVAANGTGFAVIDTTQPAIDNFLRRVLDAGGDPITDARQYLTPNPANRGGELLRLAPGRNTVTVTGMSCDLIYLQWFPTFG